MSKTDPVTLEVVRGRLETIADEMQFSLIRSAYSSVVKEAEDASSALFDLGGQQISQAASIPLLLGPLVPAVRHVLKVFPPLSMRDGDLYIFNDPYAGGNHLPDIVAVKPIFDGDSPIALAVTVAHHRDVGGKNPGSTSADATEIFQEGLRLPPLKLYEAGAPNETLFEILEHNVRLPSELRGDLGAQVSACHVGAQRLLELVKELGVEVLAAHVRELLDRSERLTREKLATIPDGCYRFEDHLDNDGVDFDRRVRVRASVLVEGSNVLIDFEGTDPQVRGPVNGAASTALSAAYFVVRAVTDPSIPTNSGCFRPLSLRLPEGSVVNPQPPAAVGARTPTFNVIVDVLLGALAQALPSLVPAASYDGFTSTFGGMDPRRDRQYVFSDIGCGGYGARPNMDGLDVFRGKGGNTLNPPIEALEMDYPVRVNYYRLRQDSGGPGMHRGGLGYEKEFELLRGSARVSHRGERYYEAPYGLDGGEPGACSVSWIKRDDGSQIVVPSKLTFVLEARDRFRLCSAGGGGHGHPHDRSSIAVLEDVLDGKVSFEAARKRYGVVIDSDAWIVDEEATGVLRAERTSQNK